MLDKDSLELTHQFSQLPDSIETLAKVNSLLPKWHTIQEGLVNGMLFEVFGFDSVSKHLPNFFITSPSKTTQLFEAFTPPLSWIKSPSGRYIQTGHVVPDGLVLWVDSEYHSIHICALCEYKHASFRRKRTKIQLESLLKHSFIERSLQLNHQTGRNKVGSALARLYPQLPHLPVELIPNYQLFVVGPNDITLPTWLSGHPRITQLHTHFDYKTFTHAVSSIVDELLIPSKSQVVSSRT